jgi:hypothetical protein
MLSRKAGASPVGLLVRNVHDMAGGDFPMDTHQLYSDYITGTSVYNGKLMIFLNPAAITESVENDKVSSRVVKKGGLA